MITSGAERFRIHIDEQDLAAMRDRLRTTRWAPDFGNDTWDYGVPADYLHELVDHWLNHYDWRGVEAEMNAYDHWRVAIDGVPIHYLRTPGVGPRPFPLILTHGWPWTFWDYRDVIGPLTDPAAHGGDPADAFELIVPSLPGFVFSTPHTTTGVGYPRVAHLWDELMTEALGYQRYGAGGGDWGAFVSAHLAHVNPPGVAGVHLTFPALMGFDYASLTPQDYGPDEAGWHDQTLYGGASGYSHMAVHITDPQTLAYSMTDSPVGLAAWMLERRRAWSDCGGDVERRFSKDQLLTSFSLYWLTGSFASAIRLYAESFRLPWQPEHDRQPTMQAPTGIAQFPKELGMVPRHICERYANLTHYTVMPRGGHFAPAEEPGLVVEDLRTFFRALR
jgi:pimeloyl-ACP methyl ester carboxylesterase